MTSRAIPLILAAALLAAPAFATPARPVPGTDRVGELLAQARSAEGRGETELALRLAQSAIVADPARPMSYVALGDIYAESGHPDFARSYYDEALSIDPAEPGALKAIAGLDHTAKPVLARP